MAYHEQRLEPSAILDILKSANKINNLPASEQERQKGEIFQAIIDLNHYFLMKPEILTQNFRGPILSIFQDPPNQKIMEILTKCIINAFKSESTTAIQPSDFSYQTIMLHVKNSHFSEVVTTNLLEIIFTLADKDANFIQNVDQIDIEYFFKYFNILYQSSQVNCMKCIHILISANAYDSYDCYLPRLLDILNSKRIDERIFQYTVDSTILILEHLLKTKTMKLNSFNPIHYCEKLCLFTSNYKDKKNLPVFIHSIILCIYNFRFTRDVPINRIDLASLIDETSNSPAFESILRLIYALIPLPNQEINDKLGIEMYNYPNKPFNQELITQIQKAFSSICNVYCTNLNNSHLCLNAITALLNINDVQLVFPLKYLYMIFFQILISGDKYMFYFISIIKYGIKVDKNAEMISRLKMIELILSKKPDTQYKSDLNQLISFFESKNISIDNTFRNISEFIKLIDSNPYLQIDIFSTYLQERKYFNQFYNLFDSYDNLNSIEKETQKIVTFFLKMLSEIPNPIQFEDDFYPYYNSLLEKNFRIKNIYPYNSIFITNDSYGISENEVKELINSNIDDIIKLFDLSMFQTPSKYMYNILFRELKGAFKPQAFINNRILINDLDQFTIRIIPQIADNFPNTDFINHISSHLSSIKYSASEGFNKFSKLGTLISKPNYFLENTIIQCILNLLWIIQNKDKNHQINFIYEPLHSNYLYQLKYFYLSTCLYSPCSKMMVNAPFLFNFSDRLFLFKLLIKEPKDAINFYNKKYKPNYVPVQCEHDTVLKFIVNRQNLFKEGLQIFERFAKYACAFEIKFKDEKGLGQGPTREFFHLMSKEFCKKRHRLWRRDNLDDDNIYVENKQGLFPYATANSKYMYDLGLFIAKAIQMEEVIDIPFNPSFFDLVNDKNIDLKDVDETLAKSLNDQSAADALIDFPFKVIVEGKSFDLIKNADNVFVTKENFHIYKNALTQFICGKHVKKVINYFVNGFSEVLDPNLMRMFSGDEMLDVINGQRELFSFNDFEKYIVIGDGYSIDSFHIQMLIQIVSEFDRNNQRLFLQFVTGFPFLPVGGLEFLNPPITIVKKYSQNRRLKDEDYLPSSQTCVNTFYLPPYPTKEIMKMKIIKAISECRESFELI